MPRMRGEHRKTCGAGYRRRHLLLPGLRLRFIWVLTHGSVGCGRLPAIFRLHPTTFYVSHGLLYVYSLSTFSCRLRPAAFSSNSCLAPGVLSSGRLTRTTASRLLQAIKPFRLISKGSWNVVIFSYKSLRTICVRRLLRKVEPAARAEKTGVSAIATESKVTRQRVSTADESCTFGTQPSSRLALPMGNMQSSSSRQRVGENAGVRSLPDRPQWHVSLGPCYCS